MPIELYAYRKHITIALAIRTESQYETYSIPIICPHIDQNGSLLPNQ